MRMVNYTGSGGPQVHSSGGHACLRTLMPTGVYVGHSEGPGQQVLGTVRLRSWDGGPGEPLPEPGMDEDQNEWCQARGRRGTGRFLEGTEGGGRAAVRTGGSSWSLGLVRQSYSWEGECPVERAQPSASCPASWAG